MTARITFIRHAQTEANEARIWQGHGDTPLTALGERQAKELGARLAGWDVSRVVASDLGRVFRTAELAGFEPTPIPELREIDIGRWEGLTSEQAAAQFPDEVSRMLAGEPVKIGGAESWSDLGARIDLAVGQLVGSLIDGEHVLVFAHGGVVHSAMSGIIGFRGAGRPWPIDRAWNTSLTTFEFGDHGPRLLMFNDATHADVPVHDQFHGTVVGFVRHGETPANLEYRWQGVTDGPLTERGSTQGRAVAEWLEVDRVYTSPLMRARLTAEDFAAVTGQAVGVDERLIEMDFGDWEDLTSQEVRDRWPEDWRLVYGDGLDLPRGGRGDTLESAAARLAEVVGDMAARHPDERVALFSHGGAIRSYICRLMGLDHRRRELISLPANVAASHVRVGEHGPVVVDHNLRAIV